VRLWLSKKWVIDAGNLSCRGSGYRSSSHMDLIKGLDSHLRWLVGIGLAHRGVWIFRRIGRFFDGRGRRLRRFAGMKEAAWQSLKRRRNSHCSQMQPARKGKPDCPGCLAFVNSTSDFSSRISPYLASKSAEQSRQPPGHRRGLSKTNSVRESTADMRRRSSDFYCFSEWSQPAIYADSKSDPARKPISNGGRG
jgi:hypothetical protein